MKKLLLFTFILIILQLNTYNQSKRIVTSYPETIFANFKSLNQQQLFDTAKHYQAKYSIDTALICYSLMINDSVSTNLEYNRRIIYALNNSAVIYMNICDYHTAYKLLIDALRLSEKHNIVLKNSPIYGNLGNIYFNFKKLDIAQSYYQKGLCLCEDTASFAIYFNNLAEIEREKGATDSAFYLLHKSLQISKSNNLPAVYNTMASLYQQVKQYDSAYCYFQRSLDESIKNNNAKYKAQTSSDLSKFFFEIKKIDSALHYMALSNSFATENNFSKIIAENYLTLSKINESKGNIKKAFDHYKKYTLLKDSVVNIDKFGEINQLQQFYEFSKTHQKIEQLIMEQQIREQTMQYQKIIWYITLGILLLVILVCVVFVSQKKKLNKAYKILVKKNIEIIELQDISSDIKEKKYRKSALTDEAQQKLLDKILVLMNDVTLICDTDFSVDKLAELTHSNNVYISQTINTLLKKNFRSLLNGYRVREAQRLLSELDTAKYTIESVALQVGFKSRAAFINSFKEITGVTPTFYLQSL